MKRNKVVDPRRVLDYLYGEHCKGVRIVHYIPLSEALGVPVAELSRLLSVYQGGSHGIRLNDEMFIGCGRTYNGM